MVLPFEEYEAMIKEIEELKKRKDRPMPDLDDIIVSNRLYGHLVRAGVKNVADLERFKRSDWLRTVGFGRISYTELQQVMKIYGLHFKDD